MSLSARQFLAQTSPKSLHHLPRPPAVPRGVHQVGLGTARNFSTARPILQDVVGKVPMAVRAFTEADIDSKKQRHMSGKRAGKKGKVVAKENREMNKRRADELPSFESSFSTAPTELDAYFPTTVTTLIHVTIPLAPPSPTGSSATSSFEEALGQTTAAHRMHRARVDAIRQRLPTPLQEETFGLDGQPQYIRLTFVATAANVRDWLGDAIQHVDIEEELPSLPSGNEDLIFPEMMVSFLADFVEHHDDPIPYDGASSALYPSGASTPYSYPSRASTPYSLPEEHEFSDSDGVWSGSDSFAFNSDDEILSEPDSHGSYVMPSASGSRLMWSSDFAERMDPFAGP